MLGKNLDAPTSLARFLKRVVYFDLRWAVREVYPPIMFKSTADGDRGRLFLKIKPNRKAVIAGWR